MAQRHNSEIENSIARSDAPPGSISKGDADEHAPKRVHACLAPNEELVLQQLQQARFWSERQNELAGDDDLVSQDRVVQAIPNSWKLTRGLELHDWQEECVGAWFKAGKRGVLKVVTGAGKTILALAIAQRLQQVDRPSLRVAIVVPTIVLLNQWQEELTSRGNLPSSAIGLMGGGRSDGFGPGVRVLICVLNSAAKKLQAEVDKAGVGNDLLLVVDECHRAGAAEMKHVFATKRVYSLGLSATPERDNDAPNDEEEGLSARDPDEVAPFEETRRGAAIESQYGDGVARSSLLPA